MDLDVSEDAERILGPVLFSQGFSIDEYSHSFIAFRDERRIIELSYYPEDPTPWLSVVLGLREPDGQLTLALWRLYPEAAILSSRESNQFDSPAELSARLAVIRDDWLDTFIWPAFEQPERFRTAWLTQQAETEERYQTDVQRGRLVQARSAYDHGDLTRAIEQYTLVGLDALTAADKRRFVMARRGVARKREG